MLEGDTFSKDYSEELQDLMQSSYEHLQSLVSIVEAYAVLPHNSQETWNRIGYRSDELSDISTQLRSNIELANEMRHELSR